jgi:3-deoxy-manno-octulosonate cytidylyltransferase (CMP-KDO synthetase)
MKVLIVIPSRYGSTRFEGKPLVDIAGKSLVRRTYEQAKKAKLNARVIVATDDQRIYDHVSSFGECMMTSPDHPSGTDRCFEVVQKTGETYDVVLNLQGDEPFILPEQIESLVHVFEALSADIATLQKPIRTSVELLNPNIVKVVSNLQHKALYFSRQPIPYLRSVPQQDWVSHHDYFRHIGMYGFRFSIIEQLMHLHPTPMELGESLEQLRWLENGFVIRVANTDFVSPAIDSPEDLLTVDNFLKINPEMI